MPLPLENGTSLCGGDAHVARRISTPPLSSHGKCAAPDLRKAKSGPPLCNAALPSANSAKAHCAAHWQSANWPRACAASAGRQVYAHAPICGPLAKSIWLAKLALGHQLDVSVRYFGKVLTSPLSPQCPEAQGRSEHGAVMENSTAILNPQSQQKWKCA